MNRTSQRKMRRAPAVFALTFTIAVACLLVWSPVTDSRAQQDRQLMQTGSPNANTGKRIALVIGNGAYTNAPPLKNPPNDARDMAVTLKSLGFEVASGINADQREMKRLIREFGQKLKAGGSGLFYYAGHGVQSKGRNYLIPVDAEIQSEAEVEDSGVDVSLVLNFMDDAQNGLNIVILDACRNNPFARSFRSASSGLAQVDAPTGTLIAYATAPGRVASDGPEKNGLYTSELLKQMRVPGLSATEMFMRVRAEVIKQTSSKQVPWEASSLVGTFYFTAPLKNEATGGRDAGTLPTVSTSISEPAKNVATNSQSATSQPTNTDNDFVSLDKVMNPAFARDYIDKPVRVKARFIGSGQTQGWIFSTIPPKVMEGRVAFRVSAPDQLVGPEAPFGSVPPHVFIDKEKSGLVFELKSGDLIFLKGSTVVGRAQSFTQVVFVATSIEKVN